MSLPPFESLVDAHGDTVLRVCRALLGPIEADDAWAETFLSALEGYPRLAGDANVRGWLVTIAHNRAIDQIRRRQRAPRPVAEVPERPVDDPSPADRDPALWGALEALAFKQRAAVAHHHLAGLSYREVGALLGCSESAARRSAADGRANLRRALDATEDRSEPKAGRP